MDEAPRKNPFLEEDLAPVASVLEEEPAGQARRSTYDEKLMGFLAPKGGKAASTPLDASPPARPNSGKAASPAIAPGSSGSPLSSSSTGAASRVSLVCEGYLQKYRGLMQRRRRWFVLTADELRYHTDPAGPVLARVATSRIVTVHDVMDSLRFQIDTDCDFGTSGGKEMVLGGATRAVKSKWLVALGLPPTDLSVAHVLPKSLLVEGPAVIVANGEKWLRLTKAQFDVQAEEGGYVMLTLLCTHIVQITIFTSRNELLISASAPLFAGSNEILCRFESVGERDKWASAFSSLLPADKMLTQ